MSAMLEAFKRSTPGLSITRRDAARFGIRVVPYCDIRGDAHELKNFSTSLRELGVTCTIQRGFLRIQGIDNCKIIAPMTGKMWYIDMMILFDENHHLDPKGIISIIKVAHRNEKHKNAITIDVAQSIINKHL